MNEVHTTICPACGKTFEWRTYDDYFQAVKDKCAVKCDTLECAQKMLRKENDRQRKLILDDARAGAHHDAR